MLGDELLEDRCQRLLLADALISGCFIDQGIYRRVPESLVEHAHPVSDWLMALRQSARLVCIQHCIDDVLQHFSPITVGGASTYRIER